MERLFRCVFKQDMHRLHIELHRHRKFQLIITCGTLGTAVLAIVLPHHGELIAIGSVATNLVWIWE